MRWSALLLGIALLGTFFAGPAAAHEKKEHVEYTQYCAPPSGINLHGHAGPVSYTFYICDGFLPDVVQDAFDEVENAHDAVQDALQEAERALGL